MALIGDDCHYFYNQACNRGGACMYRHVEEARHSKLTCDDWRRHSCTTVACPYRHTELDTKLNRQSATCYYESQPGGCTRVDCEYTHKFPKISMITPPPGFGMQPPPSGSALVRPGWLPPGAPRGPPGAPPTSAPPWHPPPRLPPPTHRFPAVPGPGGPYQPFLAAPGGPALQEPPYLIDAAGDKTMPLVEPVIINLNSEESDQESVKAASPQKHLVRTIVPPSQSQGSNPLDYFLNAKPWVDPRRQQASSPKRSSPYRDRSHSPPSPEPRLSPPGDRPTSPRGRRRSISVDRQTHRRRSPSLDRSRSQSPDTRDRRRFTRRSRTPERRPSRSPPGGRPRGAGSRPDLRSRLKPAAVRAAQLAEVKVTGSKIISTKKTRQEEQEQADKQEDTAHTMQKEGPDDYNEDEGPKSLEEIFRERALRSMMDAKRKRIQEQKKKRWESVTAEKRSESESSVKSDKGGEDGSQLSSTGKMSEGGEVAGGEPGGGGQGSSATDDSEADLADDVDVEIGVGSPDEEPPASTHSEASSPSDNDAHTEDSRPDRSQNRSRMRGAVAEARQSKPSIKSRLGVRAIEQVSMDVKERRGLNRAQARPIRARLGLKASDDSELSDRPVHGGVGHSGSEVSLRGRHSRGVLRDRAATHHDKELLLVPQITIKNTVDVEERRAGIRERLGLFEGPGEGEVGRGERRRQRELEGVLLELLEQGEVEVEPGELRLLTRKEQKKLLKKLLHQQGRQHEYDALTKKKKKAKRRRPSPDTLEEGRSRHIRVGARLGPAPSSHGANSEEEAGDQLESGDDIELGEPSPEPQGECLPVTAETEAQGEQEQQEADPPHHHTQDKPASGVGAECGEDIEKQQKEKAQKLRAALQPKTLADIRRERAHKKATGELDHAGAPSRKARRIVLGGEADAEGPGSSEPPVRVTFTHTQDLLKRQQPHKPALNPSMIWSKTDKTGRRERQIYVPPVLKRIEVSDGPALVSKKGAESVKAGSEPPPGRNVVDYGDMFGQKGSAMAPAAARQVAPPAGGGEERPPDTRATIRLQRAPPKVEVKDATVKTFAEIMAEKKRKRQQALQQTQHQTSHIIPATRNSQELPSQTSTTEEKSSLYLSSRLSPVEDTSSNDSTGIGLKSQLKAGKSLSVSSPAKSDKVTLSLPGASSSTDRATTKPGRWKRRRANAESAPASVLRKDESVVTRVEEVEACISTGRRSSGAGTGPPRVEAAAVAGHTEAATSTSSSSPAPYKHTSTHHSVAVPEKRQKVSDSSDAFPDLDDDFLNNDDEDLDLDLDNTQDHDKLMQEIDELLN